MKAFINLKNHPHIFLIVSLVILCLLYPLCLIYIRCNINDWYDSHIDKDQSGLRTFFYDYQKNWDLNFKETEVTKRLSFSSSKDKKFQRDGFFLRAIGTFSPPKSGLYKFYLRSDDGSMLYIDQNLIIDNGGIRPALEKAKTISLRKGPHLIVIEYFQVQGEAELEFNWLKTVETDKSNDLELFFHPVISNFRWDRDIDQLQEIIKLREKALIVLLRIGIIVIFIWIALILWEWIYSKIWIRGVYILKKHELLRIAILLIIVLVINFYPVFFKGKTLVTDPGSRNIQDGGGPYWEVEPYHYLNHYFYFTIKTIPLWNPYEGAGFPLAAMFNCRTFSPFGLLFSLYPSHLTMDFVMLLRLFTAGFFMYLFLKQIKINSFAAFLGSVYYMLSPAHITFLHQYQIDTTALVPAILYFLEKARRYCHRKDWIYAAIFIALAILGGQPEECVLSMSLVTLFVFIRLFYINNYPKIKYLRNYLAVVAIGLCLASFFLLPATELFVNSHVSERCFSSGEDLNLGNLMYLFFVSRIPQMPPSALYIGLIVLSLFLITILNFRSLDRSSKGYVIFSIVCLFGFLSMLFNNPFTEWMKRLPVISHIWWSKYTSTIYFALAITTSIGLNIIIKSKDCMRRAFSVFISIFLATLFIYAIYYSSIKVEFEGNLIVFYYLFIISACTILILKRNILGVTLIGLLLFVDIFLFIPETGKGRHGLPYPRAVVYLKKLLEKDPSRVYSIGIYHPLEPNRNCIYQLPIFSQSGVLRLKRYDEFARFIDLRADSFKSLRRYLDFLGVKYIYGNRGPVFEENLEQVFRDGGDCVYENKRSFPRAFIVHRAEKMFDRDSILERMSDPKFDLRRTIIVEEDIPDEVLKCRGSPLKDNSNAKVLSYTPNKVVIKAVMENDGFLVLTDTYYPGWKAYMDGKRSEIYLTDYLVRSVYLEKGEHIVEFRYSPLTFKLGCAISTSALFLLIMFLFI